MQTTPVSFCTFTSISESASESAIGISIVDVLAGAHALLALFRVHRRGRGEDHRFEAGLLQAFGEIGGPVRNLETLGDFLGRAGTAARESDNLDARNIAESLDMLHAKRALPSDAYFHGFPRTKTNPPA